MQRFVSDMKRYWRYTIYSAKSQLKTEVANSYLNWLWWVLEPLCFMFIYALVFGYMLHRKMEYYNCYIFIGLAVWDFFRRCVKSSVRMVRRNKPIVSKVYLPKYMLIVSDMMVNGFKMVICLGISFGMLLFYRVHIDWHFFLVVPVLAVTIVFTFGICTILLHLGVFIEDMVIVVEILLKFIFYLTGIFYDIMKVLPAPYNGLLTHLNAIAFFCHSTRQCMLYHTSPGWHWLGAWALFSLILAAYGVHNIYKNENTYVKVI